MSEVPVALTTKDNPYNPLTDFDSWYMFDLDRGYNSCSYLARILDTLPEDGTPEEEKIEQAINEILKYDILNVYKKVKGK